MSNLFTIIGDWRNGLLEYLNSSTKSVVDVIAPVSIFNDFLGPAVDTTNDLTFAAVNSGAIARTAGAGGIARITTGAADDDDADLATPLNFLASKGCSLEVRLAPNDVAGTAFNVGFSDATGEAADLIAITYSGTTLTSTASDFAGFFHDADATTDVIRTVAVKGDTDGTVTSTGVAAADATYATYRVDINPSGDVSYFLNGKHIATEDAAITTTAPLCAYVAVINREGAANTLDVDYIRAWAWSR
jgi:hypothetical protein